MIVQKELSLKPKSRGFHLITRDIIHGLPELKDFKIGLLHIFIKHTSAGICINENTDPTVRMDFESFFNRLVPENAPYFKHTLEGPDDMPAHIKSSMVGTSVSIPVSNGQLNLGIWQGIYLCEFRDYGGSRSLVFTINGE